MKYIGILMIAIGLFGITHTLIYWGESSSKFVEEYQIEIINIDSVRILPAGKTEFQTIHIDSIQEFVINDNL